MTNRFVFLWSKRHGIYSRCISQREVEYSKDLEIDVDRTSHSIDLEDIWQGNSKDRENRTLLTYESRLPLRVEKIVQRLVNS